MVLLRPAEAVLCQAACFRADIVFMVMARDALTRSRCTTMSPPAAHAAAKDLHAPERTRKPNTPVAEIMA